MQSHLTLFVFNCDDEEGEQDAKLEQVSEALRVAVEDWSSRAYEEPYVWFEFNRLGHFGHRVIFAQPTFRGGAYESLWKALAGTLLEQKVIDEKQATAFDQHHSHLTVCKMSKVKRSGREGESIVMVLAYILYFY